MPEKETKHDTNDNNTALTPEHHKTAVDINNNISVPLSETEKKRLFAASVSAKSNSYSPYSKFRVGCGLLLSDNSIITGCNVENITYGLTVCAERTAYLKAISEGCSSFRAVAVSTDVEDSFVLPCGQCRQFMWEFGDVDVYVVSPDMEKHQKFRLSELLPGSLRPSDLEEGRRNRPKG